MRELVVDPTWEKVNCPGCGRVLYFDNAKRTTHHQAPACQWFIDACAQTKGKCIGETRIVPPGKQSS